MGRGRKTKLTQEIQDAIAQIADRHKTWSVRDIQAKIPEFYPSLTGKVPGRTVINNYIRETIKPNLDVIEKTGIDKPWCLASLSEYPLPPEAIPIVLQVQHNVQSHRSPEEVVGRPEAGTPVTGPFTIREAQWVARLKFMEDIVTLEHWAHGYAIAERVSDITGRYFDSSEMDKAILKCIPLDQKKEVNNENTGHGKGN